MVYQTCSYRDLKELKKAIYIFSQYFLYEYHATWSNYLAMYE